MLQEQVNTVLLDGIDEEKRMVRAYENLELAQLIR
jgi:hypothetical protein